MPTSGIPLFSPVPTARIDFREYATATASFEIAKRRFILPEDIRRSAKWDQSAKEEQIVAEFAAVGHIRLHKQQQIGAQILKAQESIRKKIRSDREQEIALQVLRDRYQDAFFVPADKYRIELKEETVLAFLGVRSDITTLLVFLQVGHSAIDVMTQEVRMRRLTQDIGDSV